MKHKNKLEFNDKSIFLDALKSSTPYFSNISMPGQDLNQLNELQFKSHRKSSVLILMGGLEEGIIDLGNLYFLFTKRSHNLRHHPGEVAFPGGELDWKAHEQLRLDHFYHSALREAREEIGVLGDNVEILGHLSPLYTLSSKFLMVPVVGLYKIPFSMQSFILEKSEVEEVFWVSYQDLLLQHGQKFEEYKRNGKVFRTPLYFYEGKKIWGATGIVLKNLIDRFNKVKIE